MIWIVLPCNVHECCFVVQRVPEILYRERDRERQITMDLYAMLHASPCVSEEGFCSVNCRLCSPACTNAALVRPYSSAHATANAFYHCAVCYSLPRNRCPV
jgi:hypothetical protein